MNMQSQAITHHYNTLLTVAGRHITYTPINGSVSNLFQAIIGKNEIEVETDNFGVMTKTVQSFITKTANLPSLPKIGDKIQDSKKQYEVIDVQGKNCYDHPDPDDIWIRIYCQEI
jgi:hypothetical protein